jgi:DNA-binding response OmpR family regulator
MRLLLVEDDNILGSTLKKALEKHAYGVDWVQDGKTAGEMLDNSPFAAAILDINLPHRSGLELLRDLRTKGNGMPVMLLTARDAQSQKVEGLDSGADDYMVKPFDLGELLARLRAIMRRSEGRNDPLIRCGDVELDPAGSIVHQAGQAIALTAKEFRVLKMLMERADKYCTKGDIEYALYDADNAAESNTTEVTIYNLRKKLGAHFITSMRGVGYMVSS